jgi:hypothetical protein
VSGFQAHGAVVKERRPPDFLTHRVDQQPAGATGGNEQDGVRYRQVNVLFRLKAMKSACLYVLVHPSDPDLYKIGVTILPPKKRLAQHNRLYKEYAGQIVKETGQKWELKICIAVPDPFWAERAFWGATPFPDMPNQRGIEVVKMEWQLVQKGLDAAKKAGIRPPRTTRTTPVRNREWMIRQLEGSGITMIGGYRGLVTGMEFQCEKGNVFKESPGVVANRKSCPCCVDRNWLSGPRKGLRASLR